MRENISYLSGSAVRFCLKKDLTALERLFLKECVGASNTHDTIIVSRERWEESLLRPKLTLIIYVECILDTISCILSDEYIGRVDRNLLHDVQDEVIQNFALLSEFRRLVGFIKRERGKDANDCDGDILEEADENNLINVHVCIARYLCYIKCKECLSLLKDRTLLKRRESRRKRKRDAESLEKDSGH